MRRARHSGHVPTHVRRRSTHSPGSRQRLLILLVVAAAGLLALWLPGRNDNASATEIGSAARPPLMARMFPADHHRHRHHHLCPRPSIAHTGDPALTADPAPTAEPTRSATPWKPFTVYVTGQLVTFGGDEYRVLQDHTSLPAWQPADVPALFDRMDGAA